VEAALRKVDKLSGKQMRQQPESAVSGGRPFQSKATPAHSPEESSEVAQADSSLPTDTLTQSSADVYRTIDAGDRVVRSELMDQLSSIRGKCASTALTISLAISLGLAAILFALLMYFHGDLKLEQQASEERILQRFEGVERTLERLPDPSGSGLPLP
jgi:hypothetical protein